MNIQRAYVEITNLCNLHCDFCAGHHRPLMAMRTDDFAVAAKKLRAVTQYIYLHVMGEPLLHPELGKILDTCAQLDFRVCITTNGTLLPKKLDILLACPALHKVAVSLHSFEGNHLNVPLEDYVTGCLRSCQKLAAAGVNCTLRLWNSGMPQALNPEIERILGELTGQNTAHLPEDMLHNRRLAPRIYIQKDEHFYWPGDENNDCPDDTQYCYGLRRQLGVLCDGTVIPCCLDSEGRLALGNIFHQSLDYILNTPRAQRIRRGFDCRKPAAAAATTPPALIYLYHRATKSNDQTTAFENKWQTRVTKTATKAPIKYRSRWPLCRQSCCPGTTGKSVLSLGEISSRLTALGCRRSCSSRRAYRRCFPILNGLCPPRRTCPPWRN